jgi:deoxyribonuclease V
LIAKNVEVKHLGLENVKELCASDVAYRGDIGFGVAVHYKDGKYEHVVVSGKIDFPYIPGYLFMREAPIMMKALEKFNCDLILVDGHGLAHPRKSGIATVIGVLNNIPTIGVAKSKLYGDIIDEGGISFITVNGEKVGVKVGKYYFSIGNKVDLDDVLQLSKKGYPPILRLADRISKEARKINKG